MRQLNKMTCRNAWRLSSSRSQLNKDGAGQKHNLGESVTVGFIPPLSPLSIIEPESPPTHSPLTPNSAPVSIIGIEWDWEVEDAVVTTIAYAC